MIVDVAEVTILVEVADAGEIGGTVATATDVDIVLVGECCFPVVIYHIIVHSGHSSQFISLEYIQQAVVVVNLRAGRHRTYHTVIETTVVISIQHLGGLDLTCPTELSAIAYLWSTVLTALGLDQNNTVGSTCTIDGS